MTVPPKSLPERDDESSQRRIAAESVLPPVEPPSASFLIQLFLVPLVIVLIVVSIWGFFSWLVNSRTNPQDLVNNIQALNDASWQSAYLLSDLLRNPEYQELKTNTELAERLATILEEEIESGTLSDQRLKLRIYLCRLLGEFQLPDVIPALVTAARTERSLQEVDVRRSAIEALAVLAGQWDRQAVADYPGVMDVVLAASAERSDGPDAMARDALRATATFALGVLGTEEARQRLATLLADAHPNTRYNAATGLARRGDPRAIPVLEEMLDPDNPQAIAGETTPDGQLRKRHDVLSAALSATVRLKQVAPDADLEPLLVAIRRLARSDMPRAVRLQATEVLQLLGAPTDSH
ncbi:MAG: hypothetical protein KatS3mg110_1591 [Pirellulaceae bacterium]|nr:MAG: hypothetical protein KatS3mg110_1591 [Pirellulaceae bacterium]